MLGNVVMCPRTALLHRLTSWPNELSYVCHRDLIRKLVK